MSDARGEYERLREICCEATGLDASESNEALHRGIFALVVARHSDTRWADPAKARAEMDGVIADIRRLRQRIQRLDVVSLSELRRADLDVVAADAKSADAADFFSRAADEMRTARAYPPREQWVDHAALSHLEALEAALLNTSERARRDAAWRANGSGGRRPARAQYAVALAAAGIYHEITGEAPTYWNSPAGTSYGRMLAALFNEMGIDADPRRPAEWAIGQIARAGR